MSGYQAGLNLVVKAGGSQAVTLKDFCLFVKRMELPYGLGNDLGHPVVTPEGAIVYPGARKFYSELLYNVRTGRPIFLEEVGKAALLKLGESKPDEAGEILRNYWGIAIAVPDPHTAERRKSLEGFLGVPSKPEPGWAETWFAEGSYLVPMQEPRR